MKQEENNLMKTLTSLAKRRGFIYQGSEIYGGLAGTWDYGPLGVALKNNIKNLWWKMFVESREDMYGVDAAILMNSAVWKASGHVDTFTDPLVECTKCKRRFRSDQLKEKGICDDCGSPTGEARQFNMMFETYIGPVNPIEDVKKALKSLIDQKPEEWDRKQAIILLENLDKARSYLRPETAQGVFVNFKNVVDSFHPKLPFGIAQIGKAFRNEIAPRDFIFRVREFEQMEVEYFLKAEEWEKYFEYWRGEMLQWMEMIGLDMNHVHELEVSAEDRAHYSSRTIDFEFDFPFGRKELYGLAYRTNFDLKNHNLTYQDEETSTKIVPHVIEPSFGLDRTVLALFTSAYKEDTTGDEVRPYLAFKPSVAPVICAVSPLLKNKPELRDYAHLVYRMLKDEFGRVMWDDNGNIGKRYRRQDEIGTPWCIVVDFDTLTDDSVTIRNRDTGTQERVKKNEVVKYIKEKLS